VGGLWFEVQNMGLFDIFKRKRAKVGHDLTDEDRELSLAVRRKSAEVRIQEYEIQKLEHDLQIEELKQSLAALRGEDEDDDNDLLQQILSPMLSKFLGGESSLAPQTQDQGFSGVQEAEVILSDAAIEEKIRSFPPQYISMAKAMPDEQIRALLKSRTPYDDATITRALAILRKNF
jgi:hypothetical protein